jgi:hypothetical protein
MHTTQGHLRHELFLHLNSSSYPSHIHALYQTRNDKKQMRKRNVRHRLDRKWHRLQREGSRTWIDSADMRYIGKGTTARMVRRIRLATHGLGAVSQKRWS